MGDDALCFEHERGRVQRRVKASWQKEADEPLATPNLAKQRIRQVKGDRAPGQSGQARGQSVEDHLLEFYASYDRTVPGRVDVSQTLGPETQATLDDLWRRNKYDLGLFAKATEATREKLEAHWASSVGGTMPPLTRVI